MRYPSHVITIDEARIANAVKRSSNTCIIAEAIKEQVPNAALVSVDIRTIRISDPVAGERYIYLTPVHAQQIIIRFDQGMEIRPTKFRLRTPVQVNKMRRGEGKARRRLEGEPRKQRTRTTAQSNGSSSVPTIIGGRFPPLSNMAKDRRFGLKAFTE